MFNYPLKKHKKDIKSDYYTINLFKSNLFVQKINQMVGFDVFFR